MKTDSFGLPIPETDVEFRFWSRVAYVGASPDECWEWRTRKPLARHNSSRPGTYGRVSYEGRNQATHRVAWQMLVGPLTPDEHVDHMCENDICVNVRHLQPKPLFDNVARSPKQIAMLNRAKMHCPQGHPYDEANTEVRDGRRHCLTCRQPLWLRRKLGQA